MATPASVKTKIQSLITSSNARTGKSDKTLTSAVSTLIGGYGTGGDGGVGGAGTDIIDVTTLPTTGLAEGTVYRLTEDTAEVYVRRANSTGDHVFTAQQYVRRYGTGNKYQCTDVSITLVNDFSGVYVGDRYTEESVNIYVIKGTGEVYLGGGSDDYRLTLYNITLESLSQAGWVSGGNLLPENSVGCVRKTVRTLYRVIDGKLRKLNPELPKAIYTLRDDGYYAVNGSGNMSPVTNLKIGMYVGTSSSDAREILPGAFVGDSIRRVRIDGVTIIGDEAFASSGVSEVLWTPQKHSNAITIGNRAFADCMSLSKFTHGNQASNSRVVTIGEHAFLNCTALSKLDGIYIMGQTAELNVGDSAFLGCTALTTFTVNGAVIGRSAFEGCTSLTNVYLQEGVTTIGNQAFYRCGMHEIEIPSTVTEIRSEAFAYCRNLKKVTVLSDSITIAYFAFSGCDGIDIYVPWSEDDPMNEDAPWDATNATIHYNYTGE